MGILSRRKIMASGMAGGLATVAVTARAAGVFGNPDMPRRARSTPAQAA